MVRAKHDNTTRPTSPPRQTRSKKPQYHLPSPARKPPQQTGKIIVPRTYPQPKAQDLQTRF
jgi:hypothetical protein